MTAKEYLRQYVQIEREIGRLLEERQRWVDLATRITPVYSDTPVSGQSGDWKIPAAVERIAEQEEKIDAKISELVERRAEIERTVKQVEDVRQREILNRRYLYGQKWEKIAEDMCLDYRWVLRLHGRALQKLTTKKPLLDHP